MRTIKTLFLSLVIISAAVFASVSFSSAVNAAESNFDSLKIVVSIEAKDTYEINGNEFIGQKTTAQILVVTHIEKDGELRVLYSDPESMEVPNSTKMMAMGSNQLQIITEGLGIDSTMEASINKHFASNNVSNIHVEPKEYTRFFEAAVQTVAQAMLTNPTVLTDPNVDATEDFKEVMEKFQEMAEGIKMLLAQDIKKDVRYNFFSKKGLQCNKEDNTMVCSSDLHIEVELVEKN